MFVCFFFHQIGHQVGETPPSNLHTDSLFQVKTPENIIVFCADTSDDAQAWKASMDEARNASVRMCHYVFEFAEEVRVWGR